MSKRLITEREIHRAEQEQVKVLDVGDAVVTPSARDAAKAAGIELRGGKPAPSTKPTPASAPSPTPTAPAKPTKPTIAVGADHGGVAMRDAIAARLRELGHPVVDVGTTGTAAVDYPDFAVKVANEVAAGRARFGIMVDGAGIGSCMAANRIKGVRAAMCHDITTATNAREHNDANVLTLGGGLLGARLAIDIVETFLRVPFAGGRHQPRVDKINALDKQQ